MYYIICTHSGWNWVNPSMHEVAKKDISVVSFFQKRFFLNIERRKIKLVNVNWNGWSEVKIQLLQNFKYFVNSFFILFHFRITCTKTLFIGYWHSLHELIQIGVYRWSPLIKILLAERNDCVKSLPAIDCQGTDLGCSLLW